MNEGVTSCYRNCGLRRWYSQIKRSGVVNIVDWPLKLSSQALAFVRAKIPTKGEKVLI